jgi:hypothetical protein
VERQAVPQQAAAETLTYNSAEHTPQPATVVQPAAPAAGAAANPAASPVAAKKKSGFFSRLGHFFRRFFGAEG